VIEGTALDACFVHRLYWNEEKSEKPMVGGLYAPNKRERTANATRQQESERPGIRAERIEGMLLNSIEQLAIAEIRN